MPVGVDGGVRLHTLLCKSAWLPMDMMGQGAAIVACYLPCDARPMWHEARCAAVKPGPQLNIDGSGPLGGFDGRLPCGEG